MKAIKIFIGVVVGLLALVAVALVAVAIMFDPNDYKDLAAQKVKEITGRELVLQGDLELSVFPWIAVKTGEVILGNAPGFGDEPMVTVQSVKVALKLLPLLSASLEVGDVAIDGLRLKLMRDSKGVTNWDDLTKIGAEKGTDESEPAAQETEPDAEFQFSVGGVQISDASVSWDDQQSGKRFVVNGAQVVLGELVSQKPFDFSLKFNASSFEPQADARIEANGRLGYDAQTGKIVLTKSVVNLSATGKAVPGGKAEMAFSVANLDVDLTNQVLAAREFLLSAYGVEVVGTMTGKSFLDNPTLAGDLDIKPFDPKNTLGLLGIAVPDTSDPDALSKLAAKLKFSYLPDSFEAPEVILSLDETSIEARVKVVGFAAPSYYLRARVDDIDLDRYLPPKKEGEAETETAAGEGEADVDGPPAAEQGLIDLIRKLDVDADLNVDTLKASGLKMTDVRVRVVIKDGVLDISPANVSLYEGNISNTTRMDATGERLNTSTDLVVVGLEAGDMLRDFVGDKGFEGTTYIRTTHSVTFTGLDEKTAMPSLNGALEFRILDGVFPGVDLNGFLGDSAKLQERRSDKLIGRPDDRTEFGEMAGSLTITNGIVDNRDLCLKAPHLRAGGEGRVDGVRKEVDYLITAMLIADAKGQGGVSCDDAYGIGMPVRVTGSVLDPSFGVDGGELLAMMARGPLRLAEAGFDSLGSALSGLGEIGSQLIEEPVKAVEQVLEQFIGPAKPAATAKPATTAKPAEPANTTEQGVQAPSDNPRKSVEDAINDFGKKF